MSVKINATTSGLIETVDTSGILEIQTAGGTAIIIGADQNANFATTGAITVPVGTTAQRPTPANGMIRYNSNSSVFEVYANGTWAAANVTPAPTNSVAPVISGSAVVGQNLTSTTGTWSGSPTSYFYQWNANSTAISNATSNVFTLTYVQTGANITCNVTAANLAGNSSPATSNTLGPVVNGTTVNYLVLAGGGSGASDGGGGGAGGLQTGTTLLVPATSYTVTIGAGGAGPAAGIANGISGGNTTFTAISNVSVGGGGGGTYLNNGINGGSGGGGAGVGTGYTTYGGTGVAGQGNAGGGNGGFISSPYPSGGGGGAGQAGANAISSSVSGYGGNGTSSSISGSAVTYGGGGGGAGTVQGASAGAGGSGGGGAGGSSGNSGSAGTVNLGGGGGAGGNNNGNGAPGGSGIVIISYPGAQAFGGGVISTDGSNTIHTFYTSGSIVPITSLSASYLIVAGGGAGGTYRAGGGGAGGLLSGSNVTIDSSSTYVITVGAGGSAVIADAPGGNGTNSSFSAYLTSAIGGGGGGGEQTGSTGANGGSGGGGGTTTSGTSPAGTGTSGQGNNGGAGTTGSPYNGGGGGGAGSAGIAGNGSIAGAGGNGSSSSISGSAVTYAGGGGGGSFNGTAAAGGTGGGGAGSSSGAGTAGTANTGGGGGGGGGNAGAGGSGGSGIVFVTYPGSTPQMAGGNVTVVSNTVVHTFTSSGYLTPFVLVNNSLRFRSSASAYLNRTFTTPTSAQKFTWSGWVKRGPIGTNAYGVLFANSPMTFAFNSATYTQGSYPDDTLLLWDFGTNSYFAYCNPNPVWRDPAAWYHIVLSVDTTQATSSNRVKIYVNGVNYPTTVTISQNANLITAASHQIGKSFYGPVPAYFDGYMANINFIDGQQLTPNSFGSFNLYGVWQPVAYAGSYGINGFYLPFTNTANTTALGYDFSPQGNNWTPTNISLTAGSTYDSMKDVPTLTSANVANYAVLNPLSYPGVGSYLSNANLKISGQDEQWIMGTMGVSTGKWYWEINVASATYSAYVGVISAPFQRSDPDTVGVSTANLTSYVGNNNYKDYTASSSTSQSGTTQNTVWGVALDLTAGTISYYVANSLYHTDSTLPTSGLVTFFPMQATTNSGGPNTWSTNSYNFGQQPWTYGPPSGYLPLNTYNL